MIYLVRHGSTKLNSEKKIRGWLNVPLDEKGKEEAKATGEKLKGKVNGLVTSDLDRTQETARIISKETGAPILLVTPAFRPWDVGEYTGKKDTEVLEHIFKHAEHEPHKKLPGGESFNTFKTRFLYGLKQVIEDHPDDHIAIVTHHRGDRISAAWEREGCPANFAIDMDVFKRKGIEPGDYREIDISKKKVQKPLHKALSKYKHG